LWAELPVADASQRFGSSSLVGATDASVVEAAWHVAWCKRLQLLNGNVYQVQLMYGVCLGIKLVAVVNVEAPRIDGIRRSVSALVDCPILSLAAIQKYLTRDVTTNELIAYVNLGDLGPVTLQAVGEAVNALSLAVLR
tara:strand:+ start:6 stop:419 length:414 start_codon:yes stop_codon:yes gene_type:complete